MHEMSESIYEFSLRRKVWLL